MTLGKHRMPARPLVTAVYYPESDGSLHCQELDLKLKLVDSDLQFFRPDGQKLLTGWEEADRLAAENRQLRAELDRRKP